MRQGGAAFLLVGSLLGLCGCMDQLLSELACERGGGPGCFERARLEAVAGSPHSPVALRAGRRGCELGNDQACALLGYALLRSGKDLEYARNALQKGCFGGELYACHNLGELLEYGMGGPRDAERAAGLYTRACQAGLEYSCAFVGRHELLVGEDAQHERDGVSKLERGCEQKTKEACEALGLARIAGIGTAQDVAGGRKLLDQACSLGWKRACGLVPKFAADTAHAPDRARCLLSRDDACERLPGGAP